MIHSQDSLKHIAKAVPYKMLAEPILATVRGYILELKHKVGLSLPSILIHKLPCLAQANAEGSVSHGHS